MEEPGTSPSLEGTTPISITNKPNKSLALKLNKILGASASEDARVKAALTALADIPDLEEADLKRNLRGTIEKKEIETNKKFLEGFSHVIERLEILEAEMDHMDQVCTEMRQKLDAASAETANMVEQAHALQEKSAACNTRLIIADKLLEKFTLSDEEIRRLCSSTVPVDEEFFVALDHLQQIYHDCRLLLMTQNQQAGMQIMESMALHQETAYEKLYRWTQHESRSAFGNDSIDVSTLMTRALVALRHRPVLFQTILDELAVARREAVARAFINALTRGGPGGTPRPIELQAHDSLRYIGDMLAWIHQACASEKEMLESLFQKTPTRIGSEVTDEELAGSRPSIQIEDVIDDLLETAMEGTCRPLKSRMEQVLILQPGAITSYRVANLIQFYAITIGKLLRKNAGLSKVLYDITDMAYKYFFKTLSGQGERLLQCGDPPAKDLAVTSVVRDMTLQLKEILSSYDSSLIVATSNTDQMPEFNIGETLDAIVDPLVHMCETSVQKRSKIEQEIYLVNCMQHILTALAPFSFTKHKQQTLTDRINVLLHKLALEQYQVLLKQSGLFQIDEALRSKDPEIPLSSVAQMDARSLSAAMAHFDSFLILASSDVSPQLRSLNLSQHYQQVQDEAIRLLLDAYRRIYQAVEDPKNEYENPTSIMPRTVEEMEAIFSFAL